MHNSKPVFTAQFHPEAKGGPTDTEVTPRIEHSKKTLHQNTILQRLFQGQINTMEW